MQYDEVAQNEGVYSTASQNEIYSIYLKISRNSVNIVGINSKANVFNNVFANNLSAISASYAELYIFNNIFYLSNVAQKAITYNADKINSDNNIYYPQQTGFVEISGKEYNSLDQFQQQTDLDMHSLNSDPQFIDLDNDNFAIGNSSPAVNAGINLNLGKDFFGQDVPFAGVPDIGIAEYTGNIPGQKATLEPKLILYPNPTSGYVNIEADFTSTIFEQPDDALGKNNKTSSEIRVMDMNGKMVFTKMIENTETIFHENIDLTGIANGLYFLVLQMADKVINEKLILYK